MPQGTQDFINAAIDPLREGGHPFLLLALQDSDANGERVYSIRSGYYSRADIRAMQDLLEVMDRYLADRLAEAEQEGVE